MILSDAGLRLLASFEGYRPIAYQDIAGVWTIGYGHTRFVKEGDRCTADQALSFLRTDAQAAMDAVTHSALASMVPTTQNEFDAMVSLAFNIGSRAFAGSSVAEYHSAGLTQEAADAFLLWDKYHHEGVLTESPGLKKRRTKEREVYLNALYA